VSVADPCAGCGQAFGAQAGEATPVAAHRDRSRWLWIGWEVLLLNGLFVLWRVVGRLALRGTAGARSRGLAIWRFERRIHLPSELALQRALLPHHAVVRVLDGYYAYAFAPSLAAVLLWLLLRHRTAYVRWRRVTVAFTAVSLLVQLLPVAPPRLVGIGFVDTAKHDGTSVYTTHGLTDQLSSMPSVHVGWALLVAAAVISTARTRWRWAAALHPVVMVLAVTVSANHWWLDGVAAAALLAAVIVVVGRVRPAGIPVGVPAQRQPAGAGSAARAAEIGVATSSSDLPSASIPRKAAATPPTSITIDPMR
jgi:hypothetical protein